MAPAFTDPVRTTITVLRIMDMDTDTADIIIDRTGATATTAAGTTDVHITDAGTINPELAVAWIQVLQSVQVL